MEPALRVLVVSRSPAVRAGLRVLLEGRDGIGEGTEASPLSLGFEENPATDVVLVDSGDEEDEVLVGLRLTGPPVVVLGRGPAELPPARMAGGGYLREDAEPEEIAAALRAAARGLLVFDSTTAVGLAVGGAGAVLHDFEPGELPTEREMEVLELMGRGLANKQIAREMGISEHTVKFHVSALLGKLGAGGRTEAVTIAVRRGLLSL